MPTQGDSNTLLGVIDFSYQHYALGDLLTTQVEFATVALDHKLEHVDVAAFVNPALPSARIQAFVTPENYTTYFDNVLPIFTCNPMLRSLCLIRDPAAFNHLVLAHHGRGGAMWPTFDTHLKMRQAYPIGHLGVNAFYARHGYLPQLCAPRHYEPWARRFHAQELCGRPLVVINPRQSSLTPNPAALYRDASLQEWHSFIDDIAARRPEILFVMVGSYQEWEHSLLLRKNIFIPRASGLSLPHELALLKIAVLFMGSSSGFATFATFTDIPYAILNFEHRFAPHGGMVAGDRHYPFAHPQQVITWEPETTARLLALFDELYGNPRASSGKGARNPAPGVRADGVKDA